LLDDTIAEFEVFKSVPQVPNFRNSIKDSICCLVTLGVMSGTPSFSAGVLLEQAWVSEIVECSTCPVYRLFVR
jgi:hypothetical protein